jgi:hypothetical protein
MREKQVTTNDSLMESKLHFPTLIQHSPRQTAFKIIKPKFSFQKLASRYTRETTDTP